MITDQDTEHVEAFEETLSAEPIPHRMTEAGRVLAELDAQVRAHKPLPPAPPTRSRFSLLRWRARTALVLGTLGALLTGSERS